jgi:hypothetical protein
VIAAAHRICVRYPHRLFQSEGTTVSRWIQQRMSPREWQATTDGAVLADNTAGARSGQLPLKQR